MLEPRGNVYKVLALAARCGIQIILIMAPCLHDMGMRSCTHVHTHKGKEGNRDSEKERTKENKIKRQTYRIVQIY